jgi:hypothetical protein
LISKKSNTYRVLLPVWGICLFIVFYIVAASFYPGGSDADKAATGFSWQHNYWCELMATDSQNGKPNSARPIAILAMVVLAISLSIFWYTIPRLFTYKRTGSHIIRYLGVGSMLVLPLLLTGFHDTVINIAALFGCIAIVGLLVNLFRHKMYRLFYLGISCLLLCGINNYVYYTSHLLHHLPVIQKISFLVFLLWFILLSVKLYRKNILPTGSP